MYLFFKLLQAFSNTVLTGFLLSQMHQSSRLLLKTTVLTVLKAIKGLTTVTVKVIQVCYRDKLELRFELSPSKTTYNIPP